MLKPVTYEAGTVKSRQHTKLTSLAFCDTDHVSFQGDGRLRTIPPYAQTAISGISGVCRAIYAQRITGAHEGDCYFFGTNQHLYVQKNGVLHNITPLSQISIALAANPITTVNLSSVLTIAHTAHGKAVGDRVKFAGATTFNGVADTSINREQIVASVPNANSYTVDTGDAASAGGAGGGASVLEYPEITAGIANQMLASGIGIGVFGSGIWGAGGVSASGAQAFPRIWSFDAFGDDVVMCAGDRSAGEGQYIYIWDGDTDIAPTKLTNAPEDCNWVLVVNNSVVALCGKKVKICKLGDATVWSGLSYREKSLERVDIAHSGFRHGDKNAIIHHGNGVILLAYVGGGDIWDLSDLFEDDGVIAPYATARLSTTLICHMRGGFYQYDGGVFQKIDNQQNMDWINANINSADVWHSFGYADTERQEIYFHFPTQGEGEPSDYVIIKSGSFTLGKMDRTAAQRPAIFSTTFYMADNTDIYRHFTQGATQFDWYAQTSFFVGQNGDVRLYMDEFRPDSSQSGDITLEIIGREYPQAQDISYGTYAITASTELVTVKAAGKLLSLKFSGSNEATLGTWTQNIKTMGRR